MKLLIFDTETTGLPRIRIPAMLESNNWPHIVSISWVILNSESNKIEKQKNYIVKPLNWIILEDSIKIHGITNEKAHQEGSNLSTVIGEFLAEKYDILVAHNLEFDLNVLYNAIRWDLDLPFTALNKKSYCTMDLSRDICKLKGSFGLYKYPKLSELYEYTFKKPPTSSSLHNSLYDTLILTEIVQSCQELRRKMDLIPETQLIQKNESSKNSSRVLSLNLNS